MSEFHHATLVRTSPVQNFTLEILGEFEEVRDYHLPQLGIDDARSLVSAAYQRPATTATQTLVVRTDFITHEAQNALLKVLEEPPHSTQFIFVIPEGLAILPTLASRFFELQLVASLQEPTITEEFTFFLGGSYNERFRMVESALNSKDTAWQQSVKAGLMQYLESSSPENLKELELVARFLLTRGASNKFLLEHLALSLPVRS